jgi:hypothetical protein
MAAAFLMGMQTALATVLANGVWRLADGLGKLLDGIPISNGRPFGQPFDRNFDPFEAFEDWGKFVGSHWSLGFLCRLTPLALACEGPKNLRFDDVEYSEVEISIRFIEGARAIEAKPCLEVFTAFVSQRRVPHLDAP